MDIELVLVPTGYNFEHEEEAIHAIEQGQVDGIIVIPFGTEPMQRHLSHLVKIGMPVVAVGVHMPHLLCDAVEFDYELSGSLVAEHLLIQHHRRLAFFCTEVLYPNTSNLEMANGIRQACREVGVEFDDANIIRAPIFFRDEENSRPWAELTKMFDQPANLRPTALICETDGLAKVAYDVFGELGLKVPRDVSVTGGGDLPIASQLDPPLTTIAWPLERIGRTALRMLMDRAERRDRQPIHRVLDTNLVVRRSTNMSSNDDLERVIATKPSSSRSKSRKA
jgi:DNA-binding LacI/PurR family transcriptional regulator